jgi:hypothetical protein
MGAEDEMLLLNRDKTVVNLNSERDKVSIDIWGFTHMSLLIER